MMNMNEMEKLYGKANNVMIIAITSLEEAGIDIPTIWKILQGRLDKTYPGALTLKLYPVGLENYHNIPLHQLESALEGYKMIIEDLPGFVREYISDMKKIA